MCYSQPGALPNTHPVLSITLPVSWSTVPTFTSSRMVPSSPASRSESGTTTTTTTITVTTSSRASTTAVVPVTPTPTRTTLSSSFFTSVTPDATASSEPQPTIQPTPQPAGETTNNSSSLGTSQIVGITVGVSGAILLALAAILFARYMRKRRFQNFDQEGFIAVDGRDSMGDMSGSPGRRVRLSMATATATARLTKIFHISPPIHNPQSRQEPQRPPSKYSFKIDRNTIGLAISRPRSEAIPKHSPVVRPPSRLLPPKPTRPPRPNLTLNIPSRKPVASTSSQPPPTDRTSTMTNVTGFADLDTEAPEGAQIWRPPPSDPQSATTYYVADKWGNWVLSNRTRRSELAQVAEPAELDTYTPLTKSPAEKREEAKAMAAAISAAASVPGKRKSRRSSRPSQGSLDNNASRRASSYYLQGSPAAGRSLTRPSGSSGTGTADSVNRKRMDRGNSKDSRGSATTMDTSSSYGPYDEDSPVEPEVGRLSSLSPVMESPSPTTGRSPVQYPKINGRLDGATIRLVPPPKRPNFTASPPGQPSPTLGAVLPVRGSPSAYPPPLNPRRPWQQSGKPGPSPLASTSGSGFSPKPKPQPLPTFPVPPLNINRPLSIPGGPRPDKTAQNPPRLDTRQPLRPQHISSFVSPVSVAETTSSTTSSLLAKRLGNEKAAALALDNHNKKHGGPWRRHGESPNDPGLLSPDMAASAGSMSTPRTRLPATPTWQPKLTPTRRGEDLFLNVQ